MGKEVPPSSHHTYVPLPTKSDERCCEPPLDEATSRSGQTHPVTCSDTFTTSFSSEDDDTMLNIRLEIEKHIKRCKMII